MPSPTSPGRPAAADRYEAVDPARVPLVLQQPLDVRPHPGHSRGGKVQIEGLTSGDANYRAGSAPGPMTVRLGSDDVTSCAQNGYSRLVLVSIRKQRNRYLVGPGYRDYVHYWVPFNGDFGLHDASWQTMAWLYRWARVGSTVVTIEH